MISSPGRDCSNLTPPLKRGLYSTPLCSTNGIKEMITMITTYLICLIGLLCIPQNNSWHGIVPLHSTRKEVEKILGPSFPESKGNDAIYYYTENERVFVLYSNGPCDVQPSNGWDVPHDTVIQVSVDPKFKPKFAELNLDKKRFA